jgi:threonine synthase
MPILYHSTRGNAPELDLRGATMAGLASDGGLYVPKTWPQFSAADLLAMKDKPYLDVAFTVLKPFTDGVLPDEVLKKLLADAYASFADPAVAPLKKIDDKMHVLELFHGPTLAFKDVALQLLGGVFEHFLEESGERITVIGATSGDTGSAAMAALANRKNVNVFILYPQKGPSAIQRKQMTCIDAANIHAVAVEGTFDDCQAIVKSLFNDEPVRAKYKLAAVNSINWMRILAQMVYYFVAAARFAPKPVSFVVPTGNFGNVFAAYAATRCGLPASKLAVASNANDILTRFFETGRMKAEGVQSSLSPSMDIQVSSNFERFLFDLCDGSGAEVRWLMNEMRDSGEFSVKPEQLGQARRVFAAARVDDELTLSTIASVYKKNGYILDPHSAVGVAAARQLKLELPDPVVCLACAHPAKFPETMKRAIGLTPALPDAVKDLLQKPERSVSLPADRLKIERFMAEKLD